MFTTLQHQSASCSPGIWPPRDNGSYAVGEDVAMDVFQHQIARGVYREYPCGCKVNQMRTCKKPACAQKTLKLLGEKLSHHINCLTHDSHKAFQFDRRLHAWTPEKSSMLARHLKSQSKSCCAGIWSRLACSAARLDRVCWQDVSARTSKASNSFAQSCCSVWVGHTELGRPCVHANLQLRLARPCRRSVPLLQDMGRLIKSQ